jgi:hypothetical protein
MTKPRAQKRDAYDRHLHPDDLEAIRCIVEAQSETKLRHRVPYGVRAAAKFMTGAFAGGAGVVLGGMAAAGIVGRYSGRARR